MLKHRNLIFFLFVCISLQAQRHLVFTPIDCKDGLSENRVRNILQLHDGRMVITTEGVTNLYDGTTFKHLHLNGRNTMPLAGYSGFQHGYVDKNYVWMKNAGKLMLIDIKQECFVSRPDSVLARMCIREPIADIFLDTKQNYWIRTASDKLLFRDMLKGKTFVFRQRASYPNRMKDDLYDIAVVQRQVFLFYRFGLMVCYDLNTGRELYKTNAFPKEEKQRYDRTLMVVQSGNMLYQLRNGAGGIMLGYDIRQRKWTTILKTDYWLNTLSADNRGNLWVSCQTGLWLMDKTFQQKQFIPSFQLIDGSEINTEVSTQCNDSQGGLWIGTFNRGLLYYHADRFKFKNIGITAFGASVKNLDVTCFSESDPQGILVGTSRGLYRYEPTKNSLSLIPGISANATCLSLLKDSKRRIWLCTENYGIYCLHKDEIRHYNIAGETVRQLCETSDGQIFASANLGFGIFDPATGAILHNQIPQSKSGLSSVSQLIYLDKNRLLGRGNRGLFIYDYKKKQFSRSLNDLLLNGNQQFNSIFQDRRGRIWIGTQDGLNVWLPGRKELHTFFTEDGLVNNSIKGIEEDKQGRIWVTTSGGISCITVSGKPEKLHFSIANFNHYDGVIGNEFSSGAICMTDRGMLLMGGVNGLNAIDLQKPWVYTRLQKPLFTNLMLFGAKVKQGQSYDGNTILKNAIASTDRVELKYNQNFISVEFSALNYVNPTQTYFRYRLEGVDDDWREISAQNGTGVASYTNLSPGTYRFMVKAANNSMVWPNDYAVITIVVKAPFWETPLAYLIYLVLGLSLVYFSLRYYKRWTHRQMARKNEEKLNEMKFNFFTNISHEFRTPLTLIITPMESLLKEIRNTALEPKVRSIYRHARDLQGLVNQLLDFRRLEVSGEKLNLTYGNVVEFVQQFGELFAKLAQEKQIGFSIQRELPELYIYFDKEKMYRVLNNLLSNAFKFTPRGGKISVNLMCVEELLLIQVIDSGKGIPENELPNIFNLFYQASGTHEGSGIGLHLAKEYVALHLGEINAESEPGKQTCFTVKIPTTLIPQKEVVEITTAETIEPRSANPDKRFKLLVVEDNDDLRTFLVGELCKSYEVIEAADGEAGLELARTALPDLVISDVMMPKMNGLELCQQVKTDLQTSHIPVILLTARASEEHKLQGYQSGADEYLAKPFNLDLLLLRIAGLIEQQNNRQEQFNQKIEVNPKEITITSLDEKLIEKALTCIEKNMDNPEFSVQQFSEEMGMDRTVLYKKLQSITGLAPSEFIRSIRLKRAAQLLSQGQYSVGEVADRVGFNTPKYFTKYFREAFGVTPSQYASDHRSGK